MNSQSTMLSAIKSYCEVRILERTRFPNATPSVAEELQQVCNLCDHLNTAMDMVEQAIRREPLEKGAGV